jgi:multicomponent K+:H+ antiporter subunit A
MSLLLLALLPWAGAALVACLRPEARRTAAWLAGAVALAGTALVLAAAPAVFGGTVLHWAVPWLPSLGLSFGFRLDGLAWLFALLVTAIGALVVLYAAWYLDPKDPAPRFFAFLLLFMGAMLGVVMAGDLVLLVVFWEMTSLSSFLLIGFWTQRADARDGARMALTVTGAGGLCLLAGVLLIGQIVGSTSLDVVLASGDLIRAHPMYETALVLVLLGAFTKSAQFPFHFWLPHAMAAPTPVSSYLHSATMVKAGVFLLARLYPALGGSEPWFWIVSLTGLATLLVGAYIAIFQHDLKGLLAYSTISHLGLITLLFGLDEPLAVVAGVFHIINHATFKAGLFMSAGIIDHECGTRDMRRINGLWKLMPITALLGMVAAGAMAGVPLLNGFLSKEMFFGEAVAKQSHAAMQWVLPVGATLAGMFSVAYSTRFVHDVFFNGEPVGLPKVPHEAPFFMRLPVLLLVLVCVAVGLAPALTVGPTLAVAAQAALHGNPGPALPVYTLAIWHGFNLPLLMSLLATGGGVAIYFGLQRFVNLHRLVHLPLWFKLGGRDVFVALTNGAIAAARDLTGALHNGHLQRYLLLLVALAVAAGAWPFLAAGPSAQAAPAHLQGLNFGFAALGFIGMAAALAVVITHRRRLLALLLLGAVGLVVCLAFVALSAPDLALTQLLVEMVTVILMMLALRWLPQEGPPLRSGWRAARDAMLALAAGLGIAAVAWRVLTRPFDSISPFFLDRALPEGGGANVVNVILVDFRGFDTLGEITVLGLAALIVHALLGRFTPRREGRPGNEAERHPLMLQLVARLILPFAVLTSIYLFLRGHNLPGGGFIAGLVLAIALFLQAVANGQDWVAARATTDPGPLIAWGLLIAATAGIGSWAFGAPLLTSSYDYPLWPWVGAVPLASAALFDLGVYIVVVGATLVTLGSIARLSLTARQ